MEGAQGKRIDSRAVFRVIVAMLCLAFLGVLGLFAMLLTNTWREYAAFEQREVAQRERLQVIRAEKVERETYLRKLLDDPAFRDRVVRERLGYSREDEIIFRFDEN